MNCEIIDFHTHPFSSAKDNICSHREYCDMSADNIIRDMKAGGISKICGSVIWTRAALGEGATEWDAVSKCNECMLELWKKFGDFYIPGMMVHPDYIDASLEAVDRMYDRGVRLVGELVPYMHGWSDYSCDGFSVLLDHITDRNMIVSLHSMGEDEMDRMVRRHPDTKFVFAHPGEYGSVMRHIDRLKLSDNCYLDVSGYGIFRHGMLRHMIDEVGVEKILFGSDYPTCNPYMYVGGVMLDPMLTDEEKQAIFSGNIRRLMSSVGVEI